MKWNYPYLYVMMGKFFSIVLSLLILFQSLCLDMNDFTHIDELLEHAEFHTKKYGDDFFVFISKHYGKLKKAHGKQRKEEKKEHEELPFNHHCYSHVYSDFVLNHLDFMNLQTEPVPDSITDFYYLENYSFTEKFDIFQPPKHL